MTIAHLSDIHFGRISHEHIVEDLVRDVNTHSVDLVAVSGDLTQRARSSEFEAAASMLAAFETSVLVVPGNHDVYPWWHPIARLRYPLRRYREHISDDLSPQFHKDSVAVLGINSAHGWTIKGGRIDEEALTAIARYFDTCEDTFNVLVVHHHLTKLRTLLRRHDIVQYAQEALDVAVESGVDLILCGHLHISHIEPVEVVPGERRLLVVSAGTATSSRGRGSNRKTNFYNLISIEDDAVVIRERRYSPGERQFRTHATTEFEREAGADAEPTGNENPREASE